MVTPTTPTEVMEAVQSHLEETQSLRTRMDEDYLRWWAQREYNTNEDGGDAFRSYTSNRAKSFADKLIVTMASAEIHIKCPFGDNPEEEFAARCNDKERFVRGVFNKANAQLQEVLSQSLQNGASWHTSCRGWAAMRFLFVKDEEGSTQVEIAHWDVRNVYWGMGKKGLDWACYKVERTVDQIEAEYGVRPANHGDKDRLDVYDFYDRHFNSVVVENEYLKKPEHHSGILPRKVPIVITVVGPAPLIQSRGTTVDQGFGGADTTGNLIMDYGESIWATDRKTFDYENEVLSIYLEHVSKGREQGYVLTSPGGEKGLDDNPDETSTVVQLGTDETLLPIPRPDLTRDTAELAGIVSGEAQKGSLPDSAFGNAPFALSGIAIDILNTTQLSQLRPRLDAVERLLTQGANLLVDMYASGAFEAMEVNGFSENKEWFSATIVPARLRNLPPITIELVAQLPQDDIAKLQFANMGRDGEIPLLSDAWLRENQLGIRDEKAEADRVYRQVAERASPTARNLTLMKAAEARDDKDLAQTYLIDLIIERMTQQFQLTILQLQSQGLIGPGGAAGGGETSNNNSSNSRGNEPRGGTTLGNRAAPDARESAGPRLRNDT